MSLNKENSMMKRVFVFLLLLMSNSSYPAVTKFFQDQSIADFQKGKPENIAVDKNGNLTLSPKINPIFEKDDVLFAWTTVQDQSGNIYVGTGNKPRIYRISKEGTIELFYEAESGTSITSLAIDTDDNLYASVIPGSTVMVFKLSGSAKVLAQFEENYIWRLSCKSKGNLIVATGDSASIYEVNSKGEKKKLYSADDESHFLALDIDKKENIYFASEGKGAVYKYDAKTKKTKVLYDTYENEIRDLIVSPKGDVYIATSNKNLMEVPKSDTFDYEDSLIKDKKAKAKGKKPTSSKTKTSSSSSKKGELKNSIYKISRKGAVQKLFTRDKVIFLSLALDQQGNLYAGSGDEGIIYKIKGIDDGVIFLNTKESQVLSLLVANDEQLIVSTGNIGKVFQVGLRFASEGSFYSRIFDAGGTSNWGKIVWDIDQLASSNLNFYTRSGNSSNPDDTWSPWSKSEISEKIADIKAPKARYIQYLIVLKSDNWNTGPILKGIGISYLLENREPEVDNIQLKRENGKSLPNAGPLGKALPPAVHTLTWDSRDRDGDYLTYSVYVKNVDLDHWIMFARSISSKSYSFDSLRLADGNYVFKVKASDSSSNGDARALSSEKISDRFTIDNGNPIISHIENKASKSFYSVTGLAKDALSLIHVMEYSINGGEWKYLAPDDEIFDSNEERFSLKLEIKNETDLIKGSNVIIIRVADSNGNSISQELRFNLD